VLCRRLRVALYAEDRGAALAPAVAACMAPLLGWTTAETGRQIQGYLADLDANYPR